MKAAIYTEYGPPDVLTLTTLDKPTPAANEIRVQVQATPVGYGDLLARNLINSRGAFNMPSLFWLPARMEFGYSKPKRQVLGSDFAGIVEAVGAEVTRFSVGDAVFGSRGAQFGANAEYLCMPEDGLVALKPENMTFEEAATMPYGALTALNLLRKVDIQPGQKVLINGASGGIGSAAVQLVKHYGAEVTGVCGTLRMDAVKALGADVVIDYMREDFTRNGETYDVIFDILGRRSFADCKHSLTPNGRYLLASFKGRQVIRMLWTSVTGGRKVICALASYKIADLVLIKELIEAGVLKAVVDRCYPLAGAAEAHHYVETGQRRGNVVIMPAYED